MIYLENLEPGSLFLYKSKYFILTSDFKINGDRLCISIENGSGLWIKADTSVIEEQPYILDQQQNLVCIKNKNHVK